MSPTASSQWCKRQPARTRGAVQQLADSAAAAARAPPPPPPAAAGFAAPAARPLYVPEHGRAAAGARGGGQQGLGDGRHRLAVCCRQRSSLGGLAAGARVGCSLAALGMRTWLCCPQTLICSHANRLARLSAVTRPVGCSFAQLCFLPPPPRRRPTRPCCASARSPAAASAAAAWSRTTVLT